MTSPESLCNFVTRMQKMRVKMTGMRVNSRGTSEYHSEPRMPFGLSDSLA